MIFLLATNAIVAMLKGHAGVQARVRRYKPSAFGIPAVVMHELYYGACKSNRVAANLARLAALRFEVVPLDHEDARAAGEIRASLNKAGRTIGPYDVLIAGKAVARDLTLVTHNMREFTRIPGLRVEDWT